jgi:hypothetical protein
LNYDLLLYWTLMHDDMPFGDPIELSTNDGFGTMKMTRMRSTSFGKAKLGPMTPECISCTERFTYLIRAQN